MLIGVIRSNQARQTACTLKFFAQAFCLKKLEIPKPAHPENIYYLPIKLLSDIRDRVTVKAKIITKTQNCTEKETVGECRIHFSSCLLCASVVKILQY